MRQMLQAKLWKPTWSKEPGKAETSACWKTTLLSIDPCTLYASPQVIRNAVAEILAGYGNGSGHVFNLGHGIHPGINPEHAGAMIDAVHELSPQYHQ